MQKNLYISFLLLMPLFIWGQSTKPVSLKNPSFDGIPHDAVNPEGWHSCGLDSSPDILPGPWGVYQKPTEGSTYIGLITRENKTWETIGQKLSKSLKRNRCYKFTVDLSHSPTYASYSKPTRLRVWLGKSKCSKDKLIASSPTITHYEWKTYEFMFSTEDSDYDYIIIEAYYREPSLNYYRGNILIDNFSVFEACDRA